MIVTKNNLTIKIPIVVPIAETDTLILARGQEEVEVEYDTISEYYVTATLTDMVSGEWYYNIGNNTGLIRIIEEIEPHTEYQSQVEVIEYQPNNE